MPINESDWQAFNNVSSVKPLTLASAATITPLSYLTVLTGNVAITTITPPLPNQVHTLVLVFAGTAGVGTGGNIANTKASVAAEGMSLVYNPVTAKYTALG